MRTPAQIEASRKNGAKSHGPTTAEGKAISRFNALRHGCTAENVLVSSEDAAAFAQLSNIYYAKFQPADDVECDFVDEMVLAKWRLRRDWSNEANIINVQILRQHEEVSKEFTKLTPAAEYSLAFGSLSDHSRSLVNAARYESAHRRSFYGALAGFFALRAAVPPAETENYETNPRPADLPSLQSPTSPNDDPVDV